MKKYQILEIPENSFHAGSKAINDTAFFLQELNYIPLKIDIDISKPLGLKNKINKQIKYWQTWNNIYHQIEKNSILFIQAPFRYRQLNRDYTLKKLKNYKNIRIISLVHDVEELRSVFYNKYYQQEFQFMLEISDVIIVHNSDMKQFFLKNKGIPEHKLITLEIFDYLQPQYVREKTIYFEKSLTIAGNLDSNKCCYISQLEKLHPLKFNLYGVNFKEKTNEHIIYHGSFPPDEIPNQLQRGFGLVWDGNSIETCSGQYGEYLKYNNPHKLSLYLSSGLPIIIWAQAAMASFVKKNELGYCVESLTDVKELFNNLNEKDYQIMIKNVKNIATNLMNGHYIKMAIQEAEKRLSS